MISEATAAPPDLARIEDLGLGFASAKLLLSALELGLFSALADHPRTEQELRAELGLHGRGTTDFLTALVCLGLLERDRERYRNSPAAAQYLVRGPAYAAGFLEGANQVLYPAWGGLSTTLRTGTPQNSADFEEMLRDPQRQRMFLSMMDSLSAPLAPHLAEAIDWSSYTTVADIGGARGNLLAQLLGQYEHLSGTVFDRPQNAGACAEHTAALGVGDRVRFVGGDFFADDLPDADVLVIGHVLADFSVEQRTMLVRKAFAAVRPDGAILIYDPMPEEENPDLASLVASLHMLVMTPAGSGYRPSDCVGWLTQAGFRGATVQRLVIGNTLVIGRKSG